MTNKNEQYCTTQRNTQHKVLCKICDQHNANNSDNNTSQRKNYTQK